MTPAQQGNYERNGVCEVAARSPEPDLRSVLCIPSGNTGILPVVPVRRHLSDSSKTIRASESVSTHFRLREFALFRLWRKAMSTSPTGRMPVVRVRGASMVHRRPLWDFKVDGRAVDDFVRRIGKFDEQFVRPGGKPLDDDRFAAAIDPMPGGAVQGDVQVADSGRDIQSGRAVDRQDSEVFCPVSDNH
jgi:hypothetical protein